MAFNISISSRTKSRILTASIFAAVALFAPTFADSQDTPSTTSSVQPNNSGLIANKVGALFVFFSSPVIGCFLAYLLNVDMEKMKFAMLYAAGLFFTVATTHLLHESREDMTDALEGDPYPYSEMLTVVGFFLTLLADIIGRSVWDRRAEKVRAEEPGKAAEIDETDIKTLSLTDTLILLTALCFHAIFEGLAVGLQPTSGKVWNITLTVVMHEIFEGLALGTTLKAQNKNIELKYFLGYALALGLMAPTGITVGIILDTTKESKGHKLAEAIGNGLSSGTFICIAVSHLLAKAMRPGPDDRWYTNFIKWLFAVAGVMTTSLLNIRGV